MQPSLLVELEQQTLEKAAVALSSIERALKAWKAARKKPSNLNSRIERLKRLYKALSKWQQKVLSDLDTRDTEVRVSRLKEFTKICSDYARGYVES